MKRLAWMLFIALLCLAGKCFYVHEQYNKGRSISTFLAAYHSIDVPPEEARWMTVVITTYDVTVENLEVFTK
jgi:hypothetical protein